MRLPPLLLLCHINVSPQMVELGARPNHCCFELGLVNDRAVERDLA